MARDNHPPAMMLYFNDFVSDGIVEAMTTEELGAYFRILSKAWFESPVGTVPNDETILARWSRLTDEHWALCRARVLKAFKLGSDGRLHQKRMKQEYRKLIDARRKRKQAGKLGADSRWKKGDGNANGKALANDGISASATASLSASKNTADSRKRAGAFTSLSPADLQDTGRMLAWLARESKRRKPVIEPNEASRLRVIAAAVYAVRDGHEPVKLFGKTIAGKQWLWPNEGDYAKAERLLRDHERGVAGISTAPRVDRGPRPIGEIIAAGARA